MAGDAGYYRYPTIYGDRIVFVADDDLWAVDRHGGAARRLTAGHAAMFAPRFSPDGTFLYVIAREGGEQDLYRMPADGGHLERLTYTGGIRQFAGFRNGHPVVSSGAKVAFPWASELFSIMPDTGDAVPLRLGPALALAEGPGGALALGRNTADPATWKRYRGGTAGEIWWDPDGQGQYRRLDLPPGNVTSPMWVDGRLYFLSDHEGVGNLYSVNRQGGDLRRHTHQTAYYARNASTDGARVVFHASGDLFVYDPDIDAVAPVPVTFAAQRPQRQPRMVDAAQYLTEYAPHPTDPALAVVSRGQVSTLGAFYGPVEGFSPGSGVRQRLVRYLGRSGQLVAVDDRSGEERLCLLRPGGEAEVLIDQDLGRAVELAVSPDGTRLAYTNHRLDLYLIDVVSRTARLVDQSAHGFRVGVAAWREEIAELAWSPDSRYLAYAMPDSPSTTAIRVVDAESGQVHTVTRPVLEDRCPAWDPEGRYLYFLGQREFRPVEDELAFDMGFPRGFRPYLVTLRPDVPSPFLGPTESGEDRPPDPKDADGSAPTESRPLTIEFAGIAERVVPFPVRVGRYRRLAALKDKVLWTVFPVRSETADGDLTAFPSDGTLEAWDLRQRKRESLLDGVADFVLAADGKTLVVRQQRKLRRVRAGEKVEAKGEEPGPDTGYIDLGRITVRVDPEREWAQMLREAWRLMRDHYWDPAMAGVDWAAMYDRYAALLPRIGTRGELSDLLWEMQGELGTSHAYEMGGDYRPVPPWPHGSLAADFSWDAAAQSWRVADIVAGDSSLEAEDSPLRAPGVNIQVGDLIRAVDGRPTGPGLSPDALLWNKKNREVALTVESPGEAPRTVVVKTLAAETPARYRAWVRRNREYVHERTQGRVGYVHVPDMGYRGFAEFHRGYLSEVGRRDALIIDVRYNGGGEFSPLILEKLARRRRGWVFPRWGEPAGYPWQGPAGPLVAVTNEYAGSDGDIFSHVFKGMGLGPLIGHRTWGGVIGIDARLPLVDGSLTTQPEFAIVFDDVGLGVENYGVDPTIVVDYPPEDYQAGRDPQLDRAIDEALRLLAENPPRTPPRPKLVRTPPPLRS
jgi:tricorn protease